MRFIVRILANALAIYLAAWLIPAVDLNGNWKTLLIAGLILCLINTFIKPVLKLISLPLIFITFGLFSLIINIFIIWLLTKLIPQFSIDGLWPYLLTAIIVSVVNMLVNFLIKKDPAKPR